MPLEPIPLEDGGHPLEGQHNPVLNPEDLTAISSPELSESGEFKNISETGDQDDQEDDHQDDQWKPPALAPNLFRNPIIYAKFQEIFDSEELTRNWAHELSQHAGGMSPQETWAFEDWFDKTHQKMTAPGNYQKLIEDNIRRYQEEHGLAPVDVA